MRSAAQRPNTCIPSTSVDPGCCGVKRGAGTVARSERVRFQFLSLPANSQLKPSPSGDFCAFINELSAPSTH
jgi:hypothetical protein